VRIVDPKRQAGEAVDWREGTDSQVVTIRGVVADHAELGALVTRIRDSLSITYAE